MSRRKRWHESPPRDNGQVFEKGTAQPPWLYMPRKSIFFFFLFHTFGETKDLVSSRLNIQPTSPYPDPAFSRDLSRQLNRTTSRENSFLMAQIYRTIVSVRNSATRIGSATTHTRVQSSSQRCFNTSSILCRNEPGSEGWERTPRPSMKSYKSSNGSKSSSTTTSAPSSRDPFDKLNTGKFGRSSFPPRETSSSSSSSSSYRSSSYTSDRRPSSDRFGSQSSKSRNDRGEGSSSSSFGSDSFGGRTARTYDSELSSRKSGGPSQDMSPERDYLYSPNVVLPAIQNGFRTPYRLYYSQTVTQNRKK